MSTIYKFLPIERLSYLKDGMLRITQPGDLNDPFECLPVPPTVEEIVQVMNKVVEDKLKVFVGKPKQREEYRRQLVKSFQKEVDKVRNNVKNNFHTDFVRDRMKLLNEKIGLISFSGRWDSSLMWSHYTHSHKGFCIGFDSTNEFFEKYKTLDPKSPRVFQAVEYKDERVKAPIMSGERIDPIVLFRKSPEWAYEEELRLLVALYEATKKIENKPYDIFLLEIPHFLISEIIIGVNVDEESANEIKAFCNNHNINLYFSKVSEKKFDMEREQV